MILRRFAAAVAALAFALASTGAGHAQASVPVMIGIDGPQYDACGSLGEVTGLNPRGDNFLAVRLGPSTRFAKVDELYTADAIWVCETRGGWYGVIYRPGGGYRGCNVSSPVAAPQPYQGPCRVGWVYSRYVTIVAG